MDTIILALDQGGRKEVLKICGYYFRTYNDNDYLRMVKNNSLIEIHANISTYTLVSRFKKWKQIMKIYENNNLELMNISDYTNYKKTL